jgi:hypothetical protein
MNDLIAVEKITQWEKLKALVLDNISSPITKRVYNIGEYCSKSASSGPPPSSLECRRFRGTPPGHFSLARFYNSGIMET